MKKYDYFFRCVATPIYSVEHKCWSEKGDKAWVFLKDNFYYIAIEMLMHDENLVMLDPTKFPIASLRPGVQTFSYVVGNI